MSIDLTPFGFRKTPFTRELAVNERFALPHQVEVADALAEAVHQRMSAALIAPAGTGKTVTLRVLVASLPEARYQVRYVKVTGLSKRDLCREIAAVCGLTPTGIYPALVRKLQDTFAQCVDTDGLRPVLVLDEAHDLRPESLAMLRLLTNFVMSMSPAPGPGCVNCCASTMPASETPCAPSSNAASSYAGPVAGAYRTNRRRDNSAPGLSAAPAGPAAFLAVLDAPSSTHSDIPHIGRARNGTPHTTVARDDNLSATGYVTGRATQQC